MATTGKIRTECDALEAELAVESAANESLMARTIFNGRPRFELRDATRNNVLGFKPLKGWYQSDLYFGTPSGSPDPLYVRNTAYPKWRAANPSTTEAFLDIEFHWAGGVTQPEALIPRDAVETIRAIDPALSLGVYSTLDRNLNILTGGPAQEKQRTDLWYSQQKLLYQPLINVVNTIYPSIYFLTSDLPLYRRFAFAQIKIARDLAPGKRIVPFIWPMWHSNSKLSGDVPGAALQVALEVCRDFADGAAIWLEAGVHLTGNEPWSTTLYGFAEQVRWP